MVQGIFKNTLFCLESYQIKRARVNFPSRAPVIERLQEKVKRQLNTQGAPIGPLVGEKGVITTQVHVFKKPNNIKTNMFQRVMASDAQIPPGVAVVFMLGTVTRLQSTCPGGCLAGLRTQRQYRQGPCASGVKRCPEDSMQL